MTNLSLDFTQILGFQSAREVYGKKLVELGAKREDIVVLTADLLASNKLEDSDGLPFLTASSTSGSPKPRT